MGVQVRNPDRINIFIDGSYRFSLTVPQVVDLNLKVGQELDENTLKELEVESTYGKLYQRALEYCLVRPRSQRELGDYLYKKTISRPVKNRTSGQVSMREGVSRSVADRVASDLKDKDYVNDRSFAEYWVRNRSLRKGASSRKLRSELLGKGVSQAVIEEVMSESDRNDDEEIIKMIEKKRSRYSDDTKLMQYLARQGFSYDDIKSALDREGS